MAASEEGAAEGGEEEDDMDEILEEMCVAVSPLDWMSLNVRAKGVGGAWTEGEADGREAAVGPVTMLTHRMLREQSLDVARRCLRQRTASTPPQR